MDLPTNTVRRVLQGPTAYGLLARQGQGEGNADLWAPTAWDKEGDEKERDCSAGGAPRLWIYPAG